MEFPSRRMATTLLRSGGKFAICITDDPKNSSSSNNRCCLEMDSSYYHAKDWEWCYGDVINIPALLFSLTDEVLLYDLYVSYNRLLYLPWSWRCDMSPPKAFSQSIYDVYILQNGNFKVIIRIFIQNNPSNIGTTK